MVAKEIQRRMGAEPGAMVRSWSKGSGLYPEGRGEPLRVSEQGEMVGLPCKTG